eukprot:ctg_7463.g664
MRPALLNLCSTYSSQIPLHLHTVAVLGGERDRLHLYAAAAFDGDHVAFFDHFGGGSD